MLTKIMPELPCKDIVASIRYYREALGFRVNYEQADLGVMDRDDVRVLLIARTPTHAGPGSAYVYVRDADTFHTELRRTGARVLDEPVSHPWGLRDFHVLDLDDNQLTFGQPLW